MKIVENYGELCFALRLSDKLGVFAMMKSLKDEDIAGVFTMEESVDVETGEEFLSFRVRVFDDEISPDRFFNYMLRLLDSLGIYYETEYPLPTD